MPESAAKYTEVMVSEASRWLGDLLLSHRKNQSIAVYWSRLKGHWDRVCRKNAVAPCSRQKAMTQCPLTILASLEREGDCGSKCMPQVELLLLESDFLAPSYSILPPFLAKSVTVSA